MILAVEAKNVVKKFGNICALDNLSFQINTGEIYGLIGPNGAGKTTMLRIISTLLLPTSGIVKVFNQRVEKNATQIRKVITYLPEEAGAYRNLSRPPSALKPSHPPNGVACRAYSDTLV